ncbi:MAG: SsrA-binding protein SmpB [Gammaproteobacteria bacterium]|nr:SsrA-binding protein SmpB [Gammaproteobacteria bacterium]
MNKKKDKGSHTGTIALNKKARHDYFIEERYEAGMVLLGWEVKSLREGRVNLTDAYVLLKDGEAWLLGSHITALSTVSTHIVPENTRTRKLLLKNNELSKLFREVQQKGYTLVPLSLYWKNNRVKCEIGLAKGKQSHDKRETEREREWNKEKARVMKNKLR